VFCKLTKGVVCKLVVDALCGSSSLDLPAEIERFATHFPAGTSMKDLDHYAQFVRKPVFSHFDYGKAGNERAYGQAEPPPYNMSDFAPGVPVALFAGQKDAMVALDDVWRLESEFRPGAIIFTKLYDGFSHLTWFASSSSNWRLWSDDLWPLMAKYNA
jgi:lysosomal acid lipase/cholesteryl ester hydrolase